MSTATDTLTRTRLQPPSMWAIVFHNDDYTPFEFVVDLVQRHLHCTAEQANDFARQVHERGKAKIGSYTREVADTKTSEIVKEAARSAHPLKVTAEVA